MTGGTARLEPNEIEAIVEIVERYAGDASAGVDVRQYAELGRWEWHNDPKPPG